jgi:hypothetical protein
MQFISDNFLTNMNFQLANPCANVTIGAAGATVSTHTFGKMTKSFGFHCSTQ